MKYLGDSATQTYSEMIHWQRFCFSWAHASRWRKLGFWARYLVLVFKSWFNRTNTTRHTLEVIKAVIPQVVDVFEPRI